MIPSPPVPGWRERALAAIAEGFCPEHALPLAATSGGRRFALGGEGTATPGGWCPRCALWWRTEGAAVITNYPLTAGSCPPGSVVL